MIDNLITIGKFCEFEKNLNYPSVEAKIGKPIKEKEMVLKYMKKCKVLAVAPAINRDVLNPDIRIPDLFLIGDEKYKWRSDIAYYVEKYDLELPEEFVQHVLSQLKEEKEPFQADDSCNI